MITGFLVFFLVPFHLTAVSSDATNHFLSIYNANHILPCSS